MVHKRKVLVQRRASFKLMVQDLQKSLSNFTINHRKEEKENRFGPSLESEQCTCPQIAATVLLVRPL